MPAVTKPNQTGPLTGIRVIEMGQIAAGPFAGSLFADLGADVVKIERPDGGDGMRQWPPLTAASAPSAAFSENFASVNRNKRSVALDLKNADDVARLKQLVGVADILIENYRPGVLSKLGLGYDDLRAVNKKLIYCSISGYRRHHERDRRGRGGTGQMRRANWRFLRRSVCRI
jgi:succinate--hydroxymethylglutarate CoA-transferase